MTALSKIDFLVTELEKLKIDKVIEKTRYVITPSQAGLSFSVAPAEPDKNGQYSQYATSFVFLPWSVVHYLKELLNRPGE